MKISKRTVIQVLLILSCILPPGIFQIPSFSRWARVKYVIFIIIVLYNVKDLRILKDKLIHTIFLFCGVIFILTITRTWDITYCISGIIDILLPVLLISRLSLNYNKKALVAVKKYLAFIIVLNFILILVKPGGIYHPEHLNNGIYLLGDKNKVIEYMLPAMAVILYDQTLKVWKKWFLYSICLASYYLMDSWTGVFVFGIFILLAEGSRAIPLLKKFISVKAALIAVACFAFLAVSGYLTQSALMKSISSFTGRSINFSGRGTLWMQAIELIKKSPIIGYGAYEGVFRQFSFHTQAGILSGFSSHNGYLRLLIEGGITELLAYTLIFVVLAKRCARVWSVSREVNILAYSIVCMLLVFVMEAEYFTTVFLMAIMLCWNECMKAELLSNNIIREER